MTDSAQWHRRVIAFMTPGSIATASRYKTVKCFDYTSILTSNNPVSTTYYLPEERNFPAYATAFEKEFCAVGNGIAEPIISDPKLTAPAEVIASMGGALQPMDYNERDVVGHFGWFRGDMILVPNKMASIDFSNRRLGEILKAGDVYVGRSKAGYRAFAASSGLYRLATDVEGRVLWTFGSVGMGDAKLGTGKGIIAGQVVKGMRVALTRGAVVVLSLVL